MIPQPQSRCCVYACAAMVLWDLGVDYDFLELSGSLATDVQLNQILNKYSFQLKKLVPETPVLKKWTTENGPLLVSADTEVGGHEFIIDSIDEHKVTLRDPWHGWRVILSTKKFFEEVNSPDYNGVVPL